MHLGRKLLLTLIGLILLVFVTYSCYYQLIGKGKRQRALEADSLKNWTILTIPQGGSIYSVLGETELPMQQIGLFAINFGENIDVTTIQPGDTLKIKLTPDKNNIEKLIYIQEIDEQHNFTLRGDSLVYSKISLPVQKHLRLLKGTLDSTLDKSLLAMGLPPTEKQQINNGLECLINFQRDARHSDEFQILLEERYLGDIRLPRAKLIYVSYSGQRTGLHELFCYQDTDEKSTLNGLYSKDGKSGNTSGVGFPLNRIHTVSSFGRRIDPVYGGWRMHQGVDYKAGRGTPVFAVANGTVTMAAWNGGYGKTIVIKHPSGLSTQYAHLSSMGVRNGQTVKRGQIIGRVGSTGKSTGAHLHFGLISGKKYINPSNLKMVGTEKLNDAQMVRFREQQQQIRQLLAQYGIS